jgi:hypothetical protein
MSFAAPLFLVATLAGILPVLLHLIHRRNAKEVRFSTLRFLRLSVERTRRRRYVEDAALLVLRVAALVLVALGLARPTIAGIGALWGARQVTAVALVLDNSASMAAKEGDSTRFETARRGAEQVLDLLNSGDQVALLPTCGPSDPAHGRLFHAHATVRQSLTQAGPSFERADLAAKLAQARGLLEKAETSRKEIYVFTDNQRISWVGLFNQETGDRPPPPARDGSVPVVVVDVHRDAAPNVALRKLELRSPAPVAGAAIHVGVALGNTATVPQERTVELLVNNARVASSPTLSLAPGASATHEFRFTLDQTGVHRGEVRLAEDDGSPLDNRLYFVATVDQEVAVAIVKPRREEIAYADDAFYLERALALGAGDRAIRVTSLTPGDLEKQPLAGGRYAVVFCVNLPPLDLAPAEQLHDYVRGGGHLFWICGPNVRPDDYNGMNAVAYSQLLPAALGDLRQPAREGGPESRYISVLDSEHPALAPLADPASLYQSVLVYRYISLIVDERSHARVLARLDDGQPLLVERTIGAGSVLMLATGIQADWTNLPLKPLFLPLVARLTFQLAGAEAQQAQVLAGSPWTLPPARGGRKSALARFDVEVERPSGETIRLRSAAKDEEEFRYTDTHDAGVYLVKLFNQTPPKRLAFAVNPDPAECDPATVDRSELLRQFGTQPVVICDEPEELARAIRRMREGTGLWEGILAAVLVALVMEAFLANRLRGRAASSARPSQPRTPPEKQTDQREPKVDVAEILSNL